MVCITVVQITGGYDGSLSASEVPYLAISMD